MLLFFFFADFINFFLQKFREYVLNSNRMARLQAKYDHIRVTLGDQTLQSAEGNLTLTRRPNVGRRYVFTKKKSVISTQAL